MVLTGDMRSSSEQSVYFLSSDQNYVIVFFFFFLDFIYLFLERGKGREKERERNISV